MRIEIGADRKSITGVIKLLGIFKRNVKDFRNSYSPISFSKECHKAIFALRPSFT